MSKKKITRISRNPTTESSVYYVQDFENQIEFVTKEIMCIDNPIHRAIFDKEISALSRLKHCDNIVKLMDYQHGKVKATGQFKGLIHLEYIAGETLQQKCKYILKISDKYDVIKQLINAVRCAHENNIIHRDINPKNIMLTSDLHLKLIDFGISKIKGLSIYGTTFQFATNNYSAPEVRYQSENATERSDIYSLGAVIFFLFTKQDPPLPQDIENKIRTASGIDPLLKDILCKMTKNDPVNRFESTIDIEIAFSPLYKKYLNNGEVYNIRIDSSHLNTLRRKNLVQKGKTDNDLLTSELGQNFGSAQVRTEEKTADDGQKITIYKFDGVNYSIDCLYENDTFIVVQVEKLPSYIREKNRKISLLLSGTLNFYNMLNDRLYKQDNDNFELINRINDHMLMMRSKVNVDNEYYNTFGFWHEFIKIMIDDTKQKAIRFNYISYKFDGRYIQFILAKNSRMGDESLTKDTKIIFETIDNNKKEKIVVIGSYEGFKDDGTTLVVKSLLRGASRKRPPIPKSGAICIDYQKEIMQYKNQERALDEFRREETHNNKSLKEIFIGFENPGVFPSPYKIKFYNESLDDAQQRAVQKIFNAQDIVLIQGPPGTGKTNMIVEVVRQIIGQNRRNPVVTQRVLIVSQANAAVNKILEDLDPYLQHATTIRVHGANEEKLSELARTKYSLDRMKKRWIDEIIRKSENALCVHLKNLSIDADTLFGFVRLLEEAKIQNNTTDEKEELQLKIQEFYNTTHLSEDNRNLQQSIACAKWILHLPECKDIEEYFIRNSMIVIGTCSGFNSNMFIRHTNFDYVIVDEAAKATIPEIMVSLVKASKVVLVGDQEQLPPVFDQGVIQRADTKITIEQLQTGGFGKIYNILPDLCKERLNTQYRMHPCIGDMISKVFYGNTIQNGVSAEDRNLSLGKYSNKAMVWLSTSKITNHKKFEDISKTIDGRLSYSNACEAQILVDCIKELDCLMQDKSYSVGVITPYRLQLELIQKRLNAIMLKNISIEVDTVDAFQGSQKDIILYSTVRSSNRPSIGFLDQYPRLNVSFSRARCLLIIVGDLEFLDNPNINGNKFPEIIEHMKTNSDFCEIINI